MALFPRRRLPGYFGFSMISLLILGTGCEPQPSIHEYETTLPEPKAKSKGTRILGAIVPVGEQGECWFFKLMGPTELVEGQRAKFDQFIESIHFPNGQDRPVQWKAPEGWTEGAASKMVFAALNIDTGKDPLRLTISNASGSLQANIDRWRGQIGLPPLQAADLEKAYEKRTVNGLPVYVVDLEGSGGGGMGMMPGQLPPGHPPLQKPNNPKP
jgi:hypothetical protein